MTGRLAAIALVCAATACRAADNIFDVDKKPAQRALVTLTPDLPLVEGPQSAMTLRLKGVLADLDRLGMRQLRGLSEATLPSTGFVDGTRRVCIVQLFAGAKAKNVEIVRNEAGTLAARELDADGAGEDSATVTGIDAEKFLALSSDWNTFRADFDSAPTNDQKPVEPCTVVELARPYSPGWLNLDKDTLSGRFLRNRDTKANSADRPLGQHSIWIRLPRGYDAKKQWGLLVWISAGYLGQPPPVFDAACDELGLVCVGPAGAGNDIEIGNRGQLILDAVATACERFHVDRQRIYTTGISGGGKIASMLWACFPDIVAGSVPIVGLACYENVPVGDGTYWHGYYNRPGAATWALLRTHRCGAITGNKDFNYEPMHAVMKVFQRDGLAARIYVQKGMGHELPTSELFMEAMTWVDEPRRTSRAAEESKAAALMARYKKDSASITSDAERRKRLVEITAAAPWSAAAWEAVEEMGKR